jgi:DNA-binding CsgD family transcriptional regulator
MKSSVMETRKASNYANWASAPGPRDPGADVVPELATLVRRLAEHVATNSTIASGSRVRDATEEVILDTQVGDVRCILIRRAATLSHGEASLSPREQEIARMVARGYPNKTIAAVLDISSWTVGTHLRRIFAKLGVTSRAAMVARLLDDGGR